MDAGLFVVGLASILVVLEAAMQRRIGLDLADEGYLWHGSLRTAEGGTPMEDFRSYDPGRYYWCASFFRAFGDSILTLRAAVSVFLWLGLVAGLAVTTEVTERPMGLAFTGLVLIVWAHPRHKRFEHALSLIGVWVVLQVLHDPSGATLLMAGAVAGIGGYFGRNHAVYMVVSHIGAFLLLLVTPLPDPQIGSVGLWMLGGVLGYSPMLIRWATSPGSMRFYIREKLLIFAKRGSTNLKLPFPWPWAARRGGRRTIIFAGDVLHRLLLIGAPIFLIALAVGSLVEFGAADPVWPLAVTLVGVPYSHHAFGRADLAHLGQALSPFWLGVCMLLVGLDPSPGQIALSLAVLALAAITIARTVPLAARRISGRSYVTVDVGRAVLSVPGPVARTVNAIRSFLDESVAATAAVFFAPNYPGLYPLTGRRSPIHNTFLIFPETANRQADMIDQFESSRVEVAIIRRIAPERRSDLGLERTHPLLWAHITENMEELELPDLPNDHRAFRRPA